MSAAAAAPAADAPPKKGSKKLLIIIIAVVLLLVIGGGAAFFLLKKKGAEEGEEGAEGDGGHAKAAAVAKEKEAQAKAHKREPGKPPTYVPLDPFVVNLADRDQERYAQIGITLEVDDPKFAEELKGYMPSIRNGILMVLSHKTSGELLEREGKEKLADEVMREAVRPLGIEVDDPEEEAAAPGKKKRKKAPVYNPVQHVHFSSFIIQ